MDRRKFLCYPRRYYKGGKSFQVPWTNTYDFVSLSPVLFGRTAVMFTIHGIFQVYEENCDAVRMNPPEAASSSLLVLAIFPYSTLLLIASSALHGALLYLIDPWQAFRLNCHSELNQSGLSKTTLVWSTVGWGHEKPHWGGGWQPAVLGVSRFKKNCFLKSATSLSIFAINYQLLWFSNHHQ